MSPTYFDHNATTPLDPRILQAMLPWLGSLHGNASSVHSFGQAAREAVEEARSAVANLLGARAAEVVLCSSGTEANNAVVFGLAELAPKNRAPNAPIAKVASGKPRLVISAFEHPSIEVAGRRLEDQGFEVVRVRPSADGRIEPEAMLAALNDQTFLVCLMLANNEVGTMQPVSEVGRICRARGVPLLCDAVQAVGKVAVDVGDLAADYVVLGAHKFNGPLGAAALWVRTGAKFEGYLVGGGQERRRRAGTENLPAVVGLGEACRLADAELDQRTTSMRKLRDAFEAGIGRLGNENEMTIHGAAVERLPNTSNVAFAGVAADALMIRLDLRGFAVSAGSACASGKAEPSAALTAMGVSTEAALSSLRVSFGVTNTAQEVSTLLETLADELAALRRASAVGALE